MMVMWIMMVIVMMKKAMAVRSNADLLGSKL